MVRALELINSFNPSGTTASPRNAGSAGVATTTALDNLTGAEIAAIILGICVIIILTAVLGLFLLRDRLTECFPCLVIKVEPEGMSKTPWNYVNKYGETRVRYVRYRLTDIRLRKVQDRELPPIPQRPKEIDVPKYNETLDSSSMGKQIQITSAHISKQFASKPKSTEYHRVKKAKKHRKPLDIFPESDDTVRETSDNQRSHLQLSHTNRDDVDVVGHAERHPQVDITNLVYDDFLYTEQPHHRIIVEED